GKTLYRIMSAACGAAFMLYGWDAGIIPVIASIYNLAAGVMSLCVSFYGMQIGRKGTILLGCLLICIGALLQASTYSVGQIIVGRIVTGAGIGNIAAAVPTYMVSYQLALLISGVALAYWIDLGFVQGLDRHPWLWRIPLALQSCFAIFSAVLLFMLPDTPRWYYARGYEARGDKVLARLHALPVEHESVQAVKADIIASLEEEDDTGKISIVTLFWDNTELQFGRRLRTSFLINWIFSNLHYSPLLSGILAGVLNTCFAVASFPPIYYIEKVGRRAMMIWSALGCGVCMLIYVILTTLPASKSSVGTNWAAVAIIILYEVVFAFGWLGTCWVYGPEIAPLKYRHVAGSLGAAGEWFSTFVMVFGGGTGINAVGPKIFIWPLLCCFLAAAYVYFLCPETTGKTLEEIDALFARSPEVRERLERDIAARRAGGMPPSMKLSPRDSSDMSKMEVSTVEKI
ncbi:unnamed protein product, partial [Aureobasidium uvarum]